MDEEENKKAIKRAMSLLEKRDYTRTGLQKKLKSVGFSDESADIAIQYVESYGYIDDLRLCTNYIDYHKAQKSRQRMRIDLLKKGAAEETIERAFSDCGTPDEGEQIRKLLEKKHFTDAVGDEKEKNKIFQFLLRRGYRTGDILREMGDFDIHS